MLLVPVSHANVVWLDDLDSTAAFAERLTKEWLTAQEEPLADTLLVAQRQHAGRGRGEHSWESPDGGLYANWLAWVPASALSVVPMAVGVTLASAVEALRPAVSVGLKWPNDLVAAGRKLGGILCQSRGSGDSMWVSVGFGINLTTTPELGAGDEVRAVSLRDLGWVGEARDGIRALSEAFLAGIRGALENPEATRKQWARRTVHRKGEMILLKLRDEVVEGRFVSFDADGLLELEVQGRVRRYAVGEILFGCDSGGS
ncbi:MAG: biotin--[acetyl-CoA-carboxylase] ligase [Thermoanaerobaculaceae bacterium]